MLEIPKFFKQKQILHKYVRWMYDMVEDQSFYDLKQSKGIKFFPERGTFVSRKATPIWAFEDMYHCASELTGYVDYSNGKHIITSNPEKEHPFCNNRHCPVCTIRKSLREYSRLTWQMEHFSNEYVYYFLTLTLPNNYDGFREEMKLLQKISRRLLEYMGYNNKKNEHSYSKGVYASFEITNIGNGWHPHLHMIIAYPKEIVVSQNVRKYITRDGKVRYFENGLVLKDGKFTKTLSHQDVMEKYIECIQKVTNEYDDILSNKRFFDIGFHPCYDIEDGVNELTKYLIDFEAIKSKDDLFVYMRDCYGLKSKMKRGIFKWNKDMDLEYSEYLCKLHNESNFYFIQSSESNSETIYKCKFDWVGSQYIAHSIVVRKEQIPFSSRFRFVAYQKRIRLSYMLQNGKIIPDVQYLGERLVKNWRHDICSVERPYVNVRFDE